MFTIIVIARITTTFLPSKRGFFDRRNTRWLRTRLLGGWNDLNDGSEFELVTVPNSINDSSVSKGDQLTVFSGFHLFTRTDEPLTNFQCKCHQILKLCLFDESLNLYYGQVHDHLLLVAAQ